MFKSLTLSNFRKHTSLHIGFEQGLIAIRGANEAGKTTIQEAICYALFGTKGLRQSLADVVTYGMPETSLRVVLELQGGTFISRSKGGAEITNTGVLCTGQKECTKWVERLLGCDADMASKLMLASQAKLRGALEGGASEAVELIEQLADFDLIDRIVSLIQNKLPTGNTKAAEEMLEQQEQALDEMEVPDSGAVEELEQQEILVNGMYGQLYERQKAQAAELQALDVAGARRFLVNLAAAQRDRSALDEQVMSLGDVIERPIDAPAVPLEQVEVWRRELMGLKDLAARQAAYKALFLIEEPEVMWEGTEEEFHATVEGNRKDYLQLAAEVSRERERAYKATAKKITETSCAFCGKDLSAVPEVTRINIEADAEVQACEAQIVKLNGAVTANLEARDELLQVDRQAKQYTTAVTRYAAYIITIGDRYPIRWQWNGEPPATGVETPDYNALIAAAEKAHQGYNQAVGRRQGALQQLSELKARHDGLTATIDAALAQAPVTSELIRQAEQLEREVADLGRELQARSVELQAVRHQLALARQTQQSAAATRARQEATVALGRKQLAAMQTANALLKRVRAARPAISDKLWSIVLASVSAQFSQVRGVSSDITRSDNGFKCDGQEVQGLSGSTLDALGLCIRTSLTKTFLPSANFMMLDEPGAAMDDEREGSMLGLIAASGFDQVLLVTHSALADSFASQVVTL